MAKPISRISPSARSLERVQTTFLLDAPDRRRLLFAAATAGETPSQYLRRIVGIALDADPAFTNGKVDP